MATTQAVFPFQALENRRRKLGLSRALLAAQCGVSPATVERILSGRHPSASLENVLAIAEALGMGLKLEPTAQPKEVRERQARRKAERLVGMLQGTFGLEEQGLDAETLDELRDKTVHELLAGSKIRLWSE